MSLARTAAEVLRDHVTLEIEGIDRMYLNVYVPRLQYEGGVASFFRHHRGQRFASGALMAPMSKAFVEAIDKFVETHGVPLVNFEKWQRKDDVAHEHLARFDGEEGVFLVGRAQEKASVFRTEKRRDEQGRAFPWIVRGSAMVNHYYFYCLDRDFGPLFLKFCTYFPYTAKMCLNGHEYLKQQLHKRGVSFEALDNGLLACERHKTAQAICDGLSAEKIDAVLRKWLARLPHPFSVRDRRAGYRYDVSILQAEFSLTQVLDQPRSGRILFEDLIRENLDIGRPDRVQLVFNRRVTRRTPSRFRTRIVTQGVTPSLHVEYKHSRVKQYHKEGRALRTETTINDTRDFGVGRRLVNLPRLREIGFQANRRLLDVQTASLDSARAEVNLDTLQRPAQIDGQRVSGLRFSEPRVRAVLGALVVFRLQPQGFTNRDLREHVAQLDGISPDDISPGRMSYELRRLRLRGFVRRKPKTHRYEVTPEGLRTALFITRVHARLLRPGYARALPEPAESADTSTADARLAAALRELDAAIDGCLRAAQLAA